VSVFVGVVNVYSYAFVSHYLLLKDVGHASLHGKANESLSMES